MKPRSSVRPCTSSPKRHRWPTADEHPTTIERNGIEPDKTEEGGRIPLFFFWMRVGGGDF